MQFTEKSKQQYSRIWAHFRDFVAEVDVLWTYYSCLNSMMKRKYNFKLQELPRLTMLEKGLDTDIKNKAPIFE